MPVTKAGEEMPDPNITAPRWMRDPRLSAATIPRSTPVKRAIIVLMRLRKMVNPARSVMTLSTRRLPLIERPRSPCKTCRATCRTER